jgi:hypothetical protein
MSFKSEIFKCYVCGIEITDGQSVYCSDTCFQKEQFTCGTFRPQRIQDGQPIDLKSVIGAPIVVEPSK